MKKIFTVLALTALAYGGAKAEVVADFVPSILDQLYQELPQGDSFVSQVLIQVKYPGDVYWVSGCASKCQLVDAAGNNVRWTPDFSGIASDYSVFYMGINGLDKYVDMDYTLIVPEGTFGDTEWETSNYKNGRCNPELRYTFNVWKMAGEPHIDNTAYIFEPIIEKLNVVSVSATAKEYHIDLRFPKPVVLHENIDSYCSLRNDKGDIMSSAKIIWEVDEKDATLLKGLTRYLDLSNDIDFELYIGKGCIGTQEWASQFYCEGRANPELTYILNPINPKLPTYDFTPETDIIYQELDVDGVSTPQVLIKTKYPSEVYWVSGVSGFCSVTDKDGSQVEWTPDFTAPESDYSEFWCGLNGSNFSISNDKNYTLVVPAGAFGDAAWNDNVQTGRCNPELRISFNPSKLSGLTCVTDSKDINAPVYNLQGMPVNKENLPAGIYISNGEKFVVK